MSQYKGNKEKSLSISNISYLVVHVNVSQSKGKKENNIITKNVSFCTRIFTTWKLAEQYNRRHPSMYIFPTVANSLGCGMVSLVTYVIVSM